MRARTITARNCEQRNGFRCSVVLQQQSRGRGATRGRAVAGAVLSSRRLMTALRTDLTLPHCRITALYVRANWIDIIGAGARVPSEISFNCAARAHPAICEPIMIIQTAPAGQPRLAIMMYEHTA